MSSLHQGQLGHAPSHPEDSGRWRPPWALEAGRGHLDLSWWISSFGNTEHCLPTPAATSLCVYAHALPPFVLGELGCNCEPAPGVRDEEVPPGVGGVYCGV